MYTVRKTFSGLELGLCHVHEVGLYGFRLALKADYSNFFFGRGGGEEISQRGSKLKADRVNIINYQFAGSKSKISSCKKGTLALWLIGRLRLDRSTALYIYVQSKKL